MNDRLPQSPPPPRQPHESSDNDKTIPYFSKLRPDQKDIFIDWISEHINELHDATIPLNDEKLTNSMILTLQDAQELSKLLRAAAGKTARSDAEKEIKMNKFDEINVLIDKRLANADPTDPNQRISMGIDVTTFNLIQKFQDKLIEDGRSSL